MNTSQKTTSKLGKEIKTFKFMSSLFNGKHSTSKK
jgi:hypothetical protein